MTDCCTKDNCIHQQQPPTTTATVTIVTALYNLTRYDNNEERNTYRNLDTYLALAEHVLSLAHAMVVFTDEQDIADRLTAVRSAHAPNHAFQVIVRSLTEMPFWEKHPDLVKNEKTLHNANPKKDTVAYRILMASKFSMLQEVARENPFNTTHLAWIDLGIAHVAMPVLPAPEDWDPVNFCMLEMCHSCTKEIQSPNFLNRWRGKVGGGFLSGPVYRVLQVCHSFEQLWLQAVNQGFAPLEDMILPLVWHQHPDRFRVYYGDYEGIFVNYAKLRVNLKTVLRNAKHCLHHQDFETAYSILERILYAWLNRDWDSMDVHSLFSTLKTLLELCVTDLDRHLKLAQLCVHILQDQLVHHPDPGFEALVNEHAPTLQPLIGAIPFELCNWKARFNIPRDSHRIR